MVCLVTAYEKNNQRIPYLACATKKKPGDRVTYPFFVWICCYITLPWLSKFPIAMFASIKQMSAAKTGVGIQPNNTMRFEFLRDVESC